MSYTEIKENSKGFYSDFSVKFKYKGEEYRKKKRVFFDKGLTKINRERQCILLYQEFFEKAVAEYEDMCIDENNMTLKQFLRLYLEQVKINKSNSHYYNSYVEAEVIIEKLGHMKLKEIRPTHIQEFYNYLATLKKLPKYIEVKEDFFIKIDKLHLPSKRINKEVHQGHFKNLKKARNGEKVSYEWAIELSKYINKPMDYLFKEVVYEDYSYGSKKKIAEMLRACLQDAKRKLLVTQNYATSEYTVFFKNPNPNRKLNVFKMSEIKTLYNHVINLDTSIEKILMLLLITTGARREEIFGLRWEDVDTINGILQINTTVTTSGLGMEIKHATKNKSSNREIRVSTTVLEEILKYKGKAINKKDDAFIFTRDGINVIHPSFSATVLNRMLKELNLPHHSVHSLRHTFASIMINKLPLAEVSKMLGHSQISTTLNFYTHQIMYDKPNVFIEQFISE